MTAAAPDPGDAPLGTLIEDFAGVWQLIVTLAPMLPSRVDVVSNGKTLDSQELDGVDYAAAMVWLQRHRESDLALATLHLPHVSKYAQQQHNALLGSGVEARRRIAYALSAIRRGLWDAGEDARRAWRADPANKALVDAMTRRAIEACEREHGVGACGQTWRAATTIDRAKKASPWGWVAVAAIGGALGGAALVASLTRRARG